MPCPTRRSATPASSSSTCSPVKSFTVRRADVSFVARRRAALRLRRDAWSGGPHPAPDDISLHHHLSAQFPLSAFLRRKLFTYCGRRRVRGVVSLWQFRVASSFVGAELPDAGALNDDATLNP